MDDGVFYIDYSTTVPDGAQFKTKKCDAAFPSVKILHIAEANFPALP